MRRFRLLKLTLSILSIALIILVYLIARRLLHDAGEDSQPDEYQYSEYTEAPADLHEDHLRIFKPPEKDYGTEPAQPPLLGMVSFKQTNKNLQHRLVHLDFKGAPPKMDYLMSLLPLLQVAGATGLLVEYEDMFPYEGELAAARAGNSFSKAELKQFLEATKLHDFEVIPLIQTFGHLEYVLKLSEFRDLREVDAYPDSICPSKNKSSDLIKQMIDQVVTFHSEVFQLKWIHIGCDEVYHINQCMECRKNNNSSKQTFVHHVVNMAKYIKDKYSITPLIWDDMLRGFLPNELASSGLGGLVEPVVWVYTPSITTSVPHRVWYVYSKVFSGIWLASAFKGASGSTKLLPSLKKNFSNNLSWLNFAVGYKAPGSVLEYNFQGLVLTGWSRYHHFAVLCETLPVAVPSLLLNLVLVNTYLIKMKKNGKKSASMRRGLEKDVFQSWLRLLRCHNQKMFGPESFQVPRGEFLDEVEKKMHFCSFPGNQFYGDVLNLATLENYAIDLHVSSSYKTNGLLSYNKHHRTVINFQNSNTIEKAHRLRERLHLARESLHKSMAKLYDEHTTKEFMELRLEPLDNVANEILNITREASSINVWKKRPLM